MTMISKLTRVISSDFRVSVISSKSKKKVKTTEAFSELDLILTNIEKVPEQKLTLLVIDSKKLGEFIASEANRFFFAAIASLERSRQNQQNNISWQIVEQYYAAYYSVHYIMRIIGYSITNIDKDATKEILKTNTSAVSTTDISSGLSLLKYNKDCSEITLIKMGKGSGSHADAWKIWYQIIEKYKQTLELDITEYNELVHALIAHCSFLKRSNGSFSPTAIRNEINYQFKGDSWYFEDKCKDKVDQIQRALLNNETDLSHTNNQLLNLIHHNNFVIHFAKSIFNKNISDYPRSIAHSLFNQHHQKINFNL